MLFSLSEEKYICEHCTKEFYLKQVYNNHIIICKEKKASEEQDIQKTISLLKEENLKLKEENLKLKEEKSVLKVTLTSKDEQISKLEKMNKELMNKPFTQNNNIIDNSQHYNIYFKPLLK